MKGLSLTLAVGLLAGFSVAQAPMSKYVRTFSSSATRGFFFEAPIDFEIVDLEVPDETGKGEYLVALYNMTAAPPAFSGTRMETPVFYAEGVKSGTKAKVPAAAGAFKKGDWVAILGVAGPNTGTVSNSYGASGGANNPCTILGTPVAVGLQRCGMQQNIGTSQGVGLMWSEVAGPISRIKFTVKTPNWPIIDGARSCNYCPASNGSATLDICATNPFIAGQMAGLEMTSGGASNTGGVLAFGLLQTNTPIRGFGTICILGIQGIVPFGTGAIANGPAGGTTLTFPIPNTPAAIGAEVNFQGALSPATATGVPLTNGLWIKVGL